MENCNLRDLDMAGVRWELVETSIISDNKKQNNQHFSPENRQTNNKSNIIPPMAPINLETVKSMVMRPGDIHSLIRMIGEFNHPLRIGATNIVLPHIAEKPNGLVIITDFPSADDDLSGKILSGSTGEVTDKMLSAIGMSRENVSIIPLLFWRTPGGRSPVREELDLSLPFVKKTIEMLAPRVVITFGTVAATEIAGVTLKDTHGSEIITDKGYIVVPIFHPNYLMLKPSAKKDVWVALQNVQKLLKNA